MLENNKKEIIVKLYQSRPEYMKFFEILKSKQKNQEDSLLEHLVINGEDSNDKAEYERRKLAVDFFRELDSAGVGSFIVGRRGWKTRFIWRDQALEVLQAIEPSIKSNEDIQSKLDEAQSENVNSLRANEETRLKTFTHKYNLREDYLVNLDLPTNLTDIEAERLSAFIKTLPIKQ